MFYSLTIDQKMTSSWTQVGLSMEALEEVAVSITSSQEIAYSLTSVDLTLEVTSLQSGASLTRMAFDRVVVESDLTVVATAYKETLMEVFATIDQTKSK